jgi:hypothetical protein
MLCGSRPAAPSGLLATASVDESHVPICAYLVSDGYADGTPVADVRSLGFVPRVCSDSLKYLQHRYRAFDGEGPRQRKPAHGKRLPYMENPIQAHEYIDGTGRAINATAAYRLRSNSLPVFLADKAYAHVEPREQKEGACAEQAPR